MKSKRFLLAAASLLSLLAFFPNLSQAEIKLPAIFGDNMVLQQQTDVAVWGKAAPHSRVRVTPSWNNKSYEAAAGEDGAWKLKIATPKAGGPYELTISDGRPIKIKNVLIGEVWICSGQSNMEMPVKGYRNQPVSGSAEAISLSLNPKIRLFTVERGTSRDPLDDFKGAWKLCEPETVADFSATAYFFGRMLNRTLSVPVGLINSSWGGTLIQPWMSREGLKSFEGIELPGNAADQNVAEDTPTALYNAMIHPMVGYGLRGAIWYQGESNRNEPAAYRKLLPGLIEDWRARWGIGSFPFYYAQIAPYDYGPTGLSSAYLREAQLRASTALPNIGMACLLDIGEKTNIHPAAKETGSNRLAMLALTQVYGLKGVTGVNPVLKEMKAANGLVTLTFDGAPNGLTAYGKELSGFEVAGANKRFYPAKAWLTWDGISLMSPSVREPVAVRYAFKDFVIGDLFSTEGFPVSSFRTDDWEIEPIR